MGQYFNEITSVSQIHLAICLHSIKNVYNLNVMIGRKENKPYFVWKPKKVGI